MIKSKDTYYLSSSKSSEQRIVGFPNGYYTPLVRWTRAGEGGSFELNEKLHTHEAAIKFANKYILNQYGGEPCTNSEFPQIINLGDRRYTPNALTWLQKSIEQTSGILEDDECLVLGCNLMDYDYNSVFTDKKISIYQHEQISAPNNGWLNPRSKSKLVLKRTRHLKEWLDKAYKIYEYDADNYNLLVDMGYGDKTVLLPVTALNPYLYEDVKVDKDIDVLFYGSLNEGRAEKLSNLANDYRVVVLSHLREHSFLAGSNVELHEPAYFNDLWPYMSRAKVVLNLHYYSIQEQVRISEAVANGCYVLSERSRRNQYGDLIEQFDTFDELVQKLTVVKHDLREKYQTLNDW